jgi:hypothetical protein
MPIFVSSAASRSRAGESSLFDGFAARRAAAFRASRCARCVSPAHFEQAEANATEDLHREIGLLEPLRQLAIEAVERLLALLHRQLLHARDQVVSLTQERVDLRQRLVDARGQILAIRRAGAERLRHLAGHPLFGLELAPDRDHLTRGHRNAAHALAKGAGARLDLLGEQYLVLLGEGRNGRDVAEVRNERAALAVARVFCVAPRREASGVCDELVDRREGLEIRLGAEVAALAPAAGLAALPDGSPEPLPNDLLCRHFRPPPNHAGTATQIAARFGWAGLSRRPLDVQAVLAVPGRRSERDSGREGRGRKRPGSRPAGPHRFLETRRVRPPDHPGCGAHRSYDRIEVKEILRRASEEKP